MRSMACLFVLSTSLCRCHISVVMNKYLHTTLIFLYPYIPGLGNLEKIAILPGLVIRISTTLKQCLHKIFMPVV